MPLSNKERQAAWRARKRAEGQSTHPERQRRRDQGRPARPERQPERRPWLMIDTEGADDPAGVHGDAGRQWTYLICAASDDGFSRALHTGRPLTSAQMLAFICGLPGGYRIGGFFLGYDYSQMLWQLEPDQLRRLLGQGQPAAPVFYGRWAISLFHTQLRLAELRTPPAPDAEPPEDLRYLKGVPQRTVWDVGRFYNSRLTTALEAWQIATPDEQAFLERMKESRGDFGLDRWATDADEITAYSLMENRLTARLQTRLDQVMRELGYPLTSWYGAGSAAKAMLSAHGIKEHLDNRAPITRPKRGPAILDHLADAYFGGRFEIQAPGRYAPVHEYDICSAYPAAYRESPCVVHGTWTLSRDLTEIGRNDLFLIDWRLPSDHVWGPFPHRQRDGTICYPDAGTEHAVWGVELQAALAMWPDEIRVTRRWRYQTRCECQIFDWLERVYKRRKELGKTDKGYALRYAMNAIYGTLASALGATVEAGKIIGWCEPRWSSYYTAWTRAKLLDALALAGGPTSRDVIMFATDAIYSTRPIDGLHLADELGAWEHHEYPKGGLLIQPGLYHFQGQALETKLRGRGVAYADLQERIGAFYAAWDRDGPDAAVTMRLSARYVGMRLALARNDPASGWRWSSQERTLRFDPSGKRERRELVLPDIGMRTGVCDWFPRSAHGLTGPAPHPIFALLLLALDTGVPAVPPDAALEAISASEQPTGPMAL